MPSSISLMLRMIFVEKLSVDERNPIATFQVPTKILGRSGMDSQMKSIGLLSPSFMFWVQLFSVSVISISRPLRPKDVWSDPYSTYLTSISGSFFFILEVQKSSQFTP